MFRLSNATSSQEFESTVAVVQKLCMTVACYLFTPFGVRCAHHPESGADVKTHEELEQRPMA